MDTVTVSSKGQIAIPKSIRDALNLSEGSKLTLSIRGNELVLAKEPAWKRLQGAASGTELMHEFASFRRQERERENTGS